MPEITLISKYKKNTGLVISSTELLDLYFYGVAIQSKDGSSLNDDTIEFYIKSAQQEIENWLKVKFKCELFDDNVSYYRDDFMGGLPLIKTIYPVNVPLSLTGFYKKVEQINYPESWLSSHSNSDGYFRKRISVVPTSGSVVGTSQDVILTGITTSYYGSLGRYNTLPDYWKAQYVTGFSYKNFPYDLIQVVGQLAAIPLFAIAGDLILGAGIASQSLSIDGLSQSLSSTSSATNSGYGARIIEYRKSVDQTLKRIKNIYKGLSFTTL
jgi:hypothetical protein